MTQQRRVSPETWAEVRLAWAGRYGGKHLRIHALRPSLASEIAHAYCGTQPTMWQEPFGMDDAFDADRSALCPRCLGRLPPLLKAILLTPSGGG